MSASKQYTVSMAPHVRQGRTVRSMIRTTIIALLPATFWGFYQFGFKALLLVTVGILGAVGTEAAVCRIAKQPIRIADHHAVLVGLMLALLVPAGAPWWLVLVGAVMAILVGKMPFGPLGGSPLAPALVGLLIVAISWPEAVASHVHPVTSASEYWAADAAPAEAPQDAVTIDPSDARDYCSCSLFLGSQAGPIGAVSPLMLLIGGLFLIYRKAGRWQGAVGFMLGLGVAGWLAHAVSPGSFPSGSFQLFTGAAMFGAFFLCNDWSSTPVTPKGLFLFGLFAGVLALLFRITGGLPFGRVAFAIALMSLATPLFDRIAPTPFGKGVRSA